MALKTGLVLSGGGLRGICAQAGALIALEELGIRFDAVIGTSAGAIVGGLYCSGRRGEELRRRLTGIRRQDFLDPLGPWQVARAALRGLRGVSGYYRGEALLRWLRANLGVERLEDCDPSFHVAVTNVSRSFPEVRGSGPLAELLRASSAVPGAFALQEIEGELFADGGAANNVPLDELVKLRPDLEQLVVLTTLKSASAPRPDEPDNSFMKRPLTPFRAIKRSIDAAVGGQSQDNLNAGDRKVVIFRVRTTSIELDETERMTECLNTALADARQQIYEGVVDLSEVARDAG